MTSPVSQLAVRRFDDPSWNPLIHFRVREVETGCTYTFTSGCIFDVQGYSKFVKGLRLGRNVDFDFGCHFFKYLGRKMIHRDGFLTFITEDEDNRTIVSFTVPLTPDLMDIIEAETKDVKPAALTL